MPSEVIRVFRSYWNNRVTGRFPFAVVVFDRFDQLVPPLEKGHAWKL